MEKKGADIKSLLSKKKPSIEEIEAITAQVHSVPTPVIIPQANEKQIKRISVNAPVQLYLKCKSKATLQGMTLMDYIMSLMEKDTKDM